MRFSQAVLLNISWSELTLISLKLELFLNGVLLKSATALKVRRRNKLLH